MAKVTKNGSRLAPDLIGFEDVVDVGRGRFAILGRDGASEIAGEPTVWWFRPDGSLIGSQTVNDGAPGRVYGLLDGSPGRGLDVAVVRQIVPSPWNSTDPIHVRLVDPGGRGPDRVALDGAEVLGTRTERAIEPWGGGHAVLQPRDGPGFADWGLFLQRTDAKGRERFTEVLTTENDAPVALGDASALPGGGLAVAATFTNAWGSGAWLWFTNGKGWVIAEGRLDLYGSREEAFRAKVGEVDTELLARGDLLTVWEEGPVLGRRFDARGGALGTEMVLVEDPAAFDVDVMATEAGGFLLTWTEVSTHPVRNIGSLAVFVQEFDAMGNRVGPRTEVTRQADAGADPMLTPDGSGGAHLIWADRGWNGLGDSRDDVPQAVLHGVRTQWTGGREEAGGNGRDRLKGGKNDDILDGRGGRDVLLGRAGDDDLRGGDGNDVLKGAGGRDVLSGGRGSDRLVGGGGDDVLNGGAGRDVLIGGRGRDAFVFSEVRGRDVIRDFDPDRDVVLLEGDILARAFATGPVVEERGGSTVIFHRTMDYEVVLRGVTDLDYNTNFAGGPIQMFDI